MFIFQIALLVSAAAGPAVDFDCDKASIDGRLAGLCEDKLGRFVDAKSGPVVGRRATVLVRYEPSWGTNIYIEKVALLQRHGDSYRTLWSHDSINASGGVKHLGAPDEATVYAWKWDPRLARITVSGTRTVGTVTNMHTGRASGRSVGLPIEIYCYAPATERFDRCKS